jgi:hypothetical protein
VLGAVTAPSLLIVSSFFSARRNLPLGKIVISIMLHVGGGKRSWIDSGNFYACPSFGPWGVYVGSLPATATACVVWARLTQDQIGRPLRSRYRHHGK